VLLVLPVPTTPILVLAGALTGAGAALITVPVTLTLSRRSNEEDRGSAFALFSASFATAVAIGSIGTSPVIDKLGYETILVSAMIALAGAALITVLDRDMGRVPDSHLGADAEVAEAAQLGS
jgi:predicted MFS family arabinose efflux permease